MLNKDSKILRNSKVPWRIIEDEGILVDVSKGEVIHLNPIAASIWEKIDEQTTVGNIIDEIEQEYDVDSQIAYDDIFTFLNKLLDKGIIECPSTSKD
jgi:hypothetical protein